MLIGVFEGLLSPWHLVIIAAAVFLVFGPKRIAERFEGLSQSVQHFIDDDGTSSAVPAEPVAAAPPPKPSWSRRIARRIGRLRLRRRRR
jgi:mttA/Hcf106 family